MTPSLRSRTGIGAGPLAALAGTSAAASLSWTAVFPGTGFALALAGAAGLSVLGTAVAARTRLPLAASVVALAAAGAVYAAAVAERSAPTPAALRDVARGLRDGWAQILDATLPAPTTGGPMVTAVLLVWAAGAAAAGAHHAGRRVLSLLPALLVLLAGLVFGAGGDDVPAVAAAGLVAAGAAVLWPGRLAGRSETATGVAAGGMIAVVVAAVLLTGSRWPGADARDPYDPRRLRDQPVSVAHPPNPLASLGAAVSDHSDPVLFRARVDGPLSAWRLVVLERFDGRRWTSSGTFRRVGAGLSAADRDAPVTESTQLVRLERLAGPFLPAFPAAREVAAAGVAADGAGALVVPDGVRRPDTYRVTSAVPAYDAARIEASAPGPAGRLPRVDAAVRDRLLAEAARATAGANPSAAGTLQALAVWFNQRFALATGDDGPVPTGNGLFHIDRLLDERVGTAEQFASAFAVLARLKGYDARVAVGYRAGQRDPATGEVVVRAHHAHAWPEVRFEGIGWVAYEPTPTSARLAAEAAELAGAGSGAGEQPPGSPAPGQPPSAAISPVAPPAPVPGGDARPGSRFGTADRSAGTTAAILAAGMSGLAALAAAGVVVAKEARRRRQRAGDPAQRVAGAWSASLDRLAEARVGVGSHLAASEVAAVPALVPGVAAVLIPLAVAANAARFSGQAVSNADADAAWGAADAVAGAVRAGRSVPARAWLAVSPAPFLRRTNEARLRVRPVDDRIAPSG